ncbi:hypothetical protein L3Y34_009281 [Caenorhabditis briggsae]|uniref:Serpentine receptor class gamma n=1 Tax=Caenorhabditis briggsae TaxID=6238 RepID=A0AAE9D1T3_CAEBR|nr:hypothetical protein L3Y34_009281 [Caenorhabditis briggsae]
MLLSYITNLALVMVVIYWPSLAWVPVLIALIPLIYLVPTIVIVVKVIRAYVRNLVANKKDERINQHVFFAITLHLVTSFFYMSTDYTTIRIPATGIITNWCASVQPNHYIKTLFVLSGYFNFTAMLFPFLLSILRLIPVYYPIRTDEVAFIFSPTSSAYLLALRPYGSDCDFVVVPWVFYMTHPIFREKKIVPINVVRAQAQTTV